MDKLIRNLTQTSLSQKKVTVGCASKLHRVYIWVELDPVQLDLESQLLSGCCLSPLTSELAQAAVTKHHILGGLKRRHLFLLTLEVGKSKTRALACLVPTSWLADGHHLTVSSHDLLCVSASGERVYEMWCLFLLWKAH